MTPQQYLNSFPKPVVEATAVEAGTTYSNFVQIVRGKGSVSKFLAERLAAASGNSMTELEILYPERYLGSNIEKTA